MSVAEGVDASAGTIDVDAEASLGSTRSTRSSEDYEKYGSISATSEDPRTD